jgi:hypothetical protein
MNTLTLLDRMGGFVSQIVAQCQFWCLLGGFAVLLALYVAAVVAALQLIETLVTNEFESQRRKSQ